MRTRIMLVVAVSVFSCGAPQGPISVRGIFPFLPSDDATGCSFATGELRQGAFSLVDVAAQDPEARILVELAGQELFTSAAAQPPLVLTGGRILAPAGRDTARVERVDLRYVSRPAIPGITASTVDSIPFTAAASDDLLIPVPLFGREMTRRLNELPADNAATFDVTVSFEVVATMVLSGAQIRTATTPFPVRIVKSEVTCAGADTRLARFAPGTAPAIRACSYFGLGRRFTADQCCSSAANAGQPGCEPQ